LCDLERENISPKTLGKIADALEVNPEDILEEE
jgi:DNA-binding Xre family transcriptional regulator